MNLDKTNPGIPVVLSFLFNGLGQLYNGEIRKGLVIIFISAISMLILLIGAILIGFWLLGGITYSGLIIFGGLLFALGIISICFIGIYSIQDAYRVATKK